MGTSMILFDSDLKEIGPYLCPVDIEVGTTDSAKNDFEISGHLPEGAAGFYIPGTEYGGIVEYETTGSRYGMDNQKGHTWRGLLTQGIIQPPAGSDYKIVSGDANTIIRNILSGHLGGFFTVPTSSSGITISSYQFKLYCTIHEGLTDMLLDNDAKLQITAEKGTPGGPIKVTVQAVPAETIPGTYNDDSPVSLKFTENNMGINHLLCLGRGELQNREKIDLYINAAGKVSETQYYTGFAERTAKYDYTSAQSLDDLKKNGKKRLLEIASSKKLQIMETDRDADIGDIVTGKKGRIQVSAPIGLKIVKLSAEGVMSIECKVTGEN